VNIKVDQKTIQFFLFAYWHDPRWKKFVGATVKIWDLAENLQEEGHAVTLVLPNYGFKKLSANFNLVEVPFIDLPVVRLITYNFLLLFVLFTRFLFSKRAGVVYVRRMTSLTPLIYAKLTRKLFFYEINDDPYHLGHSTGPKGLFSIKAFISRKIDELNLFFCDRSFVISRNVLDKIKAENPTLDSEKCLVAPSGSNTKHFYPRDQAVCRDTLRLDPQSRYVGFVGSLLKHQGIDTLIAASQLVVDRVPACKFLIVGEGPMRRYWENKVASLRLTSFFKFTGQVEYARVPIWINAMDLCVAPFLKTAGFRSPVKIFDYMACGKAVVASQIRGTTDIFLNSGAIQIVPSEHPAQLAIAISLMLGDTQLTTSMGKAGRQFILRNHDRKQLAQQVRTNSTTLLTRKDQP